MEEIYINIVEKKIVCNECYNTRLTFFESEVKLSFGYNYIVTDDFSTFNCYIFYARQRADRCWSCAEYVIELNEQENEDIVNDVDFEASTIIHNNNE